jgi:DNA-binding CsgD family transcriptional regulator
MLAWHEAPAAAAAATATTSATAIATGTPMRERRDSALPLTPAEQRVFRWLREGKTNWEISRILNKSEWTVKTQVQQILRKLDAPSRHDVMAGYRPRAAGTGSVEQSG